MRHRHTVEQYGVRVEISTKTHRISHSSTRSSLTGRSWPWFESMIRVRVSRCCPHVMHATARRNCQPPYGRDRRMDRICSGVMQQWIPGDTPSTGRRHTGKPLGRPVKALPILLPVSSTPCRSMRFIGSPAARLGSPPRLRRAGRTSRCLAATPSSTRQPVKAYPPETLRLVFSLPIRMSISVSNLRARELLLAPRSWSLSAPSGLGLSHARGCKPVEYRPPARVIAVCCALHHLGLVGSHSHALALTFSLGPRCLVCRRCSLLCRVNHIGVSPSVSCTQGFSLVTLSFPVVSITQISITFAFGRSVSVSLHLIMNRS